MDRFLFCFITASLSSLLWPYLAPIWFTIVLGTFGVLLFKTVKTLSGVCLGITWMLSVGHWIMQAQPEQALFLDPVQLGGQVESVVSQPDKVTFNFIVYDYASVIESKKLRFKAPRFRVRLSWQVPDLKLKQGQRLLLTVKLKPRWGLYNEAGFNYQQWLFAEDIRATGFVKSVPTNKIVTKHVSIRQRIADKLLSLNRPEVRWLLAMVIGYRGELSQQDWQLLQRTGTSHLVAISGMHIGMVALWSYGLVCLISGIVNLLFSRPIIANIKIFAVSCSLIIALFYAYLAGFATPTLRAGTMLLLGWGLLISGINWGPRRFILFSLWLFIMLFPLSIFSASFWLSFSAIIILWFIAWRQRSIGDHYWQKITGFIQLQIMLSLLMLPLTLGMFGVASLLSPIVNLIAIPFVTFVLLPLSLFSLFWLLNDAAYAPVLVDWCLTLFAASERFLNVISFQQDVMLQANAVTWFALCFAGIATIILLLPKGGMSKALALILFIPLILPKSVPSIGAWQLDMLDVGQGLALVITKQGGTLLYDVGAELPDGFSMAENVILPVLNKHRITQLDAVIISHADIDHAGGLQTVMRHQRVSNLRSGMHLCRKGQRWLWQGIQFEVLWPDPDYSDLLSNDNNQSCVIMLDDGANRILLTGDIEGEVELLLAQWHRSGAIDLRATIMIAPHHGSKTSSSGPFVSSVAPHYVLISTGHYNRWGMPADIVIKRLKKLNAEVFNTATHGQVTVTLDKRGAVEVKGRRTDILPRWYLQR